MRVRSITVVVVMILGLVADGHAQESVKVHYKRGLSAFALGNYTQAASEYEKAFNIDPQPALLYDAAQAHRLAGNKTRALQLYQSYLALFGERVSNRDEVAERVLALKRAISDDAAAAKAAAEPKRRSPSRKK